MTWAVTVAKPRSLAIRSTSRRAIGRMKSGMFSSLRSASGAQAIPFDRAHLYLQVSSRSNYAPREIYFDNVEVNAGK